MTPSRSAKNLTFIPNRWESLFCPPGAMWHSALIDIAFPAGHHSETGI
jgi:hypothetical protein